MLRLISSAPSLGAVAAFLAVAVGCERFEPELVSASRFQFAQGAHERVACADCHPDEPATAQIVTCVGTAPSWDGVGCLQCHECDRVLHPDGAGHFTGQDCVACHALTDANWAAASGGGTLTGGEDNCSGACHGVARADSAPLDDAHGAHLDDSLLWSTPGSCDMCHPPGLSVAPTHDNDVVDLPFGDLAFAEGATPTFVNGTCANYCHGATLPEGGATPSWTGGAADGACGTCHGNPPGLDHVAIDTCDVCHLPTGGSGGVIADPASHINGIVEAI